MRFSNLAACSKYDKWVLPWIWTSKSLKLGSNTMLTNEVGRWTYFCPNNNICTNANVWRQTVFGRIFVATNASKPFPFFILFNWYVNHFGLSLPFFLLSCNPYIVADALLFKQIISSGWQILSSFVATKIAQNRLQFNEMHNSQLF